MSKGHGTKVTACAVTPDGSRFVSASEDNTLVVWDALTGEALHTLTGHTDRVTHCAVGADGSVYSAGPQGVYDIELRAWSAETGEQLWARLLTNVFEPVGLVADPAGCYVAVLGSCGYLQVRDPATGEHLTVTEPAGSAVGCSMTPDGRFILVGSQTEIRVVDPRAGEVVRTIPYQGYGRSPMTTTPDGRGVLLNAVEGGLSRVDLDDPGETRALAPAAVLCCTVSAAGDLVVTVEDDAGVHVRRLGSGEQLHHLAQNTEIDAAVLLADGATLLTVEESRLRVWDAVTGDNLGELPLDAVLTCLAVHPSRAIAAYGDEAGGFAVLDLGLELGPVQVAPVDRGAGAVVRCPGCGTTLVQAMTGEVATCPGCATVVAVSDFTLRYRIEPVTPIPSQYSRMLEGDIEVALPPELMVRQQPSATPLNAGTFLEKALSDPEAAKGYIVEHLAALPPPTTAEERLAREFLQQTVADLEGPGAAEQRLSEQLGFGGPDYYERPWRAHWWMFPRKYDAKELAEQAGVEGASSAADLRPRWSVEIVTGLLGGALGYLATSSVLVGLVAAATVAHLVAMAAYVRHRPRRAERALFVLVAPVAIAGAAIGLRAWWGSWSFAALVGVVAGYLLSVPLRRWLFRGIVHERL
jgi:hypothetical protein